MQPGNARSIDPADVVLDAAAAPVFAVEPTGRITLWNASLASFTGVPAARALGLSFPDTFLFPQDAELWRRLISGISVELSSVQLNSVWKIDGSPRRVTTLYAMTSREFRGDRLIVCTVIPQTPAVDHRALSARLLEDRTLELSEISRFLHDTIAQDLVQVSFLIDKISSESRDLPLHADALDALERVEICCRDARLLGGMLAPVSLAETSFESWLENHAAWLRSQTGLKTILDVDPLPDSVPADVKSLLSAACHMWAARVVRVGGGVVTVRLRHPASAVALELEMRCEPPLLQRVVFAQGWTLLRERAMALGGTLDIVVESGRALARLLLPLEN